MSLIEKSKVHPRASLRTTDWLTALLWRERWKQEQLDLNSTISFQWQHYIRLLDFATNCYCPIKSFVLHWSVIGRTPQEIRVIINLNWKQERQTNKHEIKKKDKLTNMKPKKNQQDSSFLIKFQYFKKS